MTKEEIQIFTRRVTSGNKTDLVVTTYDIILIYFRDAKAAWEQKDVDNFVWNVKKANDFVNELVHALDCKYDIGKQLLSLYRYIQEILNQCILKRTEGDLSCAKSMIEKLKASFEEVAKQDMSGPVVEQSGQIYAGLTYGKGTLNESYHNMSDGFQV